MGHRVVLVGLGLAIAALWPQAASAADIAYAPAPVLSPAPVSDWTVTLGVEGRILPTFEGAKGFDYTAFPVFQFRRAGSNARFRSPRDGFGFAVFDEGNFRLGPVGKLKRERREGDNAAVAGLGNVNWAVELGGFAEYWWLPWLRTRAELRNGITGHHGLVGDLSADAVYKFAPKWTLAGGPRMILASAQALDPYFGISTAQAIASGLPVYATKGGMRSYGAGVQLRYDIGTRWETYTYLEYERLTGDAANSPLVVQRGTRDQFSTGLGVTYSFDVALPW